MVYFYTAILLLSAGSLAHAQTSDVKAPAASESAPLQAARTALDALRHRDFATYLDVTATEDLNSLAKRVQTIAETAGKSKEPQLISLSKKLGPPMNLRSKSAKEVMLYFLETMIPKPSQDEIDLMEQWDVKFIGEAADGDHRHVAVGYFLSLRPQAIECVKEPAGWRVRFDPKYRSAVESLSAASADGRKQMLRDAIPGELKSLEVLKIIRSDDKRAFIVLKTTVVSQGDEKTNYGVAVMVEKDAEWAAVKEDNRAQLVKSFTEKYNSSAAEKRAIIETLLQRDGD